jgi:hypothetical protein
MKRLKPEKVRKGFDTPEAFFLEAERYYKNAKEKLKEAKIKYNRYQDTKPVREACGTCYLAVLLALDGYFLTQGILEELLPSTTAGYRDYLNRYLSHNGKVKQAFSLVWEDLHVFGYYKGASHVDVVKAGFKEAKFIIDTLSRLKSKTKMREV